MSANRALRVDLSPFSPKDRIDIICDAFESAWIDGSRPGIQEFLDHSQFVNNRVLFKELLLVDCEYRRKHDCTLAKSDYLDMFPKFAEQIESTSFEESLVSTTPHVVTTTLVDDFRAGSRVGHFELLEKLGSGAAGDVWKARDTRLQRFVAVKIPRNRHLSDDEIRRFLREGQAAAQLNHENIVRVHEVNRSGSLVFIVSEFVDGSDLKRKLRSQGTDIRTTVEICAQLAEALHHAHQHGVIHRDFKPANVLLGENDKPKIADFGLAKWSEDSSEVTLGGQVLGTPAYMSPEQARGGSFKVDSRTDIYSLGVILYETLTGKVPFMEDQNTLLSRVINEEPPMPRTLATNVPRDLETICLKCLEKEPKHRYPSAQEVAIDLRRFQRGQAILARRAGPMEKGWRWFRRRPAVAAALLFALLAAGSFASRMMLAEDYEEALGYQTVTLTTEPPGAKVAFVLLDEHTGEPDPNTVVRLKGRSPVTGDLLPGDYLVVATLEDGRFHEVFRHVPKDTSSIPGAFNHQFWKLSEGGDLLLPVVKIPKKSVTLDMALVEVGAFGRAEYTPPTNTTIDLLGGSFYMDTTEFTHGEFVERVNFGNWPLHLQKNPPAKRSAMPANYDRAVSLAESVGKRLPTEAEFEYAAMNYAPSVLPWNDTALVHESKGNKFGDVARMSADQLITDPPIFGIRSNLAEWTSSGVFARVNQDMPRGLNEIRQPTQYRIVKGGNFAVINGNPRVTQESRNYSVRIVLSRFTNLPGLGFRCVRTVKPRFVGVSTRQVRNSRSD